MANLRKKIEHEEDIDDEENGAVNVDEVHLNDDEESVPTFEMLAGYTDSDNVIHREYTLREMTGRDEEAISKSDVRNNGSKIANILLSRCVLSIGTLTPKSVGGRDEWMKIIRKLYTNDQDTMMLKLREISIGKTIKVKNRCPNPECRADLTTEIGIDEIEILPFKGLTKIPFELDKGFKDKNGKIHKTGTIRLPTGFDREVLTPLAKKNLAKGQTTMLTRLCKFDDGAYVDDDLMSGLTVRDREHLQDLLQDNFFGPKLEVEITCDSCGEEFKGSLNAQNFI